MIYLPSVVAALLSARLEFQDTISQALAAVDNGGCAPLHTAVEHNYLECTQQVVKLL